MNLAKITGAKRNRRVIGTVFVVGLVVGSAGIAAALTMTDMGTEQISLFNSGTSDSDFTIQSYDTAITGTDSVDVVLTLNNGDAAAHNASVTVQLLDSSGNVLTESTQETGSVAASETYSTSYNFTGTDLATQYEKTFIVVDQTN
ncbi:MAG TPA: FxLYD domain-containing protein [Halococcus sp.]|nr:FxLYD domain-containing protein [Halococcus sp.]